MLKTDVSYSDHRDIGMINMCKIRAMGEQIPSKKAERKTTLMRLKADARKNNYSCFYCKMQFSSRHKLKSHPVKEKHFKEVKERQFTSANVKEFKCVKSECGEVFESALELAKHCALEGHTRGWERAKQKKQDIVTALKSIFLGEAEKESTEEESEAESDVFVEDLGDDYKEVHEDMVIDEEDEEEEEERKPIKSFHRSWECVDSGRTVAKKNRSLDKAILYG